MAADTMCGPELPMHVLMTGAELYSGDRQVEFWPQGGWTAVTNAYQSPVMTGALPSLHPANSAARLRAISSLFAGPLRDPASRTEDAAIGLLRFHHIDPDHESICQHGGGHDDTLHTHSGYLLWPERREIWATAGPPCHYPLEGFDVRAGRCTGFVERDPLAPVEGARAAVLAG